MGIKVLPPSLNRSFENFSVDENKNINFGFSAIKGIGDGLSVKIIENRPYKNATEFIEKVNPNIKQTVQLIKAGCFGTKKRLFLEKYRDSFLESLTIERKAVSKATLKKYAMTEDEYWNKKEKDLKEKNIKKNKEHIESFNEKYMTDETMWEIESLNMFLTNNPLKVLDIMDFKDVDEGMACTIAGAIVDIQNKKDKSNKKYVYIKLYTTSGIIEGVVWASKYEVYHSLIKNGKIVVCLAKKENGQFSVSKMKDYFAWKKETGRK